MARMNSLTSLKLHQNTPFRSVVINEKQIISLLHLLMAGKLSHFESELRVNYPVTQIILFLVTINGKRIILFLL